ncbi:MAG TPA: translation initiation factor 2 [Actinoplanes sp.]
MFWDAAANQGRWLDVPDMFFLSASGFEPVRSLQESLGTERILWTGRCAVAEYAFDEPASLPRWTLPEETGVVVTETRVIFVDPAGPAGGELHWLWPQHLRVQPGNRDTGRSATVTQIQLVCNGPGGAFPALVFAGGDLATVGDADRLANVLRQSIARFRVEHSGELGLAAPQARMLSRLVIGPEFNNYQGGEGQTVSLLGSMAVEGPVGTGAWPAAAPVEAAGWEQEPFLDEYLPADYADDQNGYPGYAPDRGGYAAEHQHAEYEAHPYADYQPPPQPMPAPHPLPASPPVRAPEPQYTDLASRAADLAARVAGLVSANAGAEQSLERYETQTTNLSSFLAEGDNGPAAEDRAEAARRTAARFAGNSARARTTGQRPVGDEHGTRHRNA